MDKLERIKAEIERLKEKSKSVEMDTEYTLAWLLDFINSLPEESVSILYNASKKYPPTGKEIIVLRNDRIYYGKCIDYRHRYVRVEIQLTNDMAQTYAIIDYLTKKDKWIYVEDLLNLFNVEKTGKEWKEPVSEDLEEASNNYAESEEKRVGCGTEFFTPELAKAFKAGSQWQKEQFEKNRLAACDAQTKEEADRECNFVEKMIKEEHRQPTFDDAIKYGMQLHKKKMMSNAIDATIEHMPNDYGEFRPCIHVKVDRTFKKGERVKVIIIKKEEV